MPRIRELIVGVPDRIVFNRYTYWPVPSAITNIPEFPVETANGDVANSATAPVVGASVSFVNPISTTPEQKPPLACTSLA
jgi:hypothetical protein